MEDHQEDGDNAPGCRQAHDAAAEDAVLGHFANQPVVLGAQDELDEEKCDIVDDGFGIKELVGVAGRISRETSGPMAAGAFCVEIIFVIIAFLFSVFSEAKIQNLYSFGYHFLKIIL